MNEVLGYVMLISGTLEWVMNRSVDPNVGDDLRDIFAPGWKEEMKKRIDRMLLDLSPREADVLRQHFGIGCEVKSWRELAELYNESHVGIREIERVALAKLRANNIELLCLVGWMNITPVSVDDRMALSTLHASTVAHGS